MSRSRLSAQSTAEPVLSSSAAGPVSTTDGFVRTAPRLIVDTEDGQVLMSLRSAATIRTEDEQRVWWVAGAAGEDQPAGVASFPGPAVRAGQPVGWRVRFLRSGD
jgi:hypothetical protein